MERKSTFAVLASFLFGACAVAQSIPLQPVAIEKGEFQYFLDDYLIENRFDQKFLVTVRHFVHKGQPEEQNPVLTADKPWEVGGLIGPASVLYDRDRKLFRAYYHLYASPDKTTPARIGYAESADGVHWTKPALCFFPSNGEKTNIVLQTGNKDAGCFQIVDVPESEKNGAAFLGYYIGSDGGYLAGSKDGVEWKSLQKIVPERSDCQHSVVFDKLRKEFLIYYRNLQQFKQVADNPKSGTTRVISRISSKKLFTLWDEMPKAVILPEEKDAPLFYGMSVAVKNHVYFGFLEQFELYPHETIEVELRTSRDGLAWKRYADGDYLIKRGPYGQWNGGMVKPAGLVEFGNQWLVYYTGYGGYHNEALKKGAAMGLLRFRKEGFVSVRSHQSRLSYLITRPLVWPGGGLAVNFDGVDVFPKAGFLKAQVVDAKRTVIIGFSYDDCVAFKGDDVRARIQWKTADISNLAGKEIRLEFQFQYGDLYGFVAE